MNFNASTVATWHGGLTDAVRALVSYCSRAGAAAGYRICTTICAADYSTACALEQHTSDSQVASRQCARAAMPSPQLASHCLRNTALTLCGLMRS
jgi:hypothetical protein